MDSVGSGTAAQIEKMLPVGHIDDRNDMGCQTHGHIEHAH